MAVIKVTDQTTRAEIEAILAVLRAEQQRSPVAWAERYHARYDALLTDWQRARA